MSLEVSQRVRNYSMYFKGGRFYLVLPRTTLDVLQDGLSGQSFTDAVIQKRGEDFVLSFSIKAGTSAKIVERSSGIDVVFSSTQSRQDNQ